MGGCLSSPGRSQSMLAGEAAVMSVVVKEFPCPGWAECPVEMPPSQGTCRGYLPKLMWPRM